MAVNGVCPECGYKFPLHQALADADARQALAAVLELPAQLAKWVPSYLALLSPPGRAIVMPKLARLLRELTALVTSAQVTRKRITHAAPLELWAQGIEATLAARDAGSLILPLADHDYLCEVVWRLAAKSSGKQQRQADDARPLHPSHRVVQPDEVLRRGSGGLVSTLQMLQKKAPNEAIRKQLADAEKKLTGE